MRIYCIAFIAMACFLQGCALPATGPAFTPVTASDPDKAIVYIYRESTFGLGGRPAYFYIDGVNVFDLSTGGYSWVSLSAGTYKVRQSWPFDVQAKFLEANITVKAGEVRYFSFGTGGCAGGYRTICISYELHEVDAKSAGPLIASKKFQDNFGMAKLNQTLKAKP